VSSDDELTRLSSPVDDAATRLETEPTGHARTGHAAAAALKSGSSSSGWLASSGAIDHGRFPPGTVLGGRYRIVGRAGRGGIGGMGEIYRADDLKLGQAVALEFLPPDVDRDPARLTQLHTEVRMARGLFDAGLLWLTYLGLEPYIRRYAPDTLIGWTRLVAGRWKDPRVGADVMIGVSAGLAMTLFYALHNVLPPFYGQLEPRPFTNDVSLLAGTRHVLGYLLSRIGSGIQASMLCVVGVVALLMLLKREWLAAVAAIVIFTPVAINGMFPQGTPWLDIGLGLGLMSVFVFTILRYGLLSTTAALITHFVLLRAPITTDLSSWRGPYGLWFLGVVAAMGLGACYVAGARTTTERETSR